MQFDICEHFILLYDFHSSTHKNVYFRLDVFYPLHQNTLEEDLLGCLRQMRPVVLKGLNCCDGLVDNSHQTSVVWFSQSLSLQIQMFFVLLILKLGINLYGHFHLIS